MASHKHELIVITVHDVCHVMSATCPRHPHEDTLKQSATKTFLCKNNPKQSNHDVAGVFIYSDAPLLPFISAVNSLLAVGRHVGGFWGAVRRRMMMMTRSTVDPLWMMLRNQASLVLALSEKDTKAHTYSSELKTTGHCF